MPSKIIATCFALGCFACALVVGVVAGNSGTTVLTRALLVMMPAWLVARIIGSIAERVVVEQIEQYKVENPIPDDHEALVAASREIMAEPVVDAANPLKARRRAA